MEVGGAQVVHVIASYSPAGRWLHYTDGRLENVGWWNLPEISARRHPVPRAWETQTTSKFSEPTYLEVWPDQLNRRLWNKFSELCPVKAFYFYIIHFLISISFTSSSKVRWFTQVHNPTLPPVFCRYSLVSILPGAQSRCIPGIPNNGVSSMLACIYPRKRPRKSCLDWNSHTKSSGFLIKWPKTPRNGKDSEKNFVV